MEKNELCMSILGTWMLTEVDKSDSRDSKKMTKDLIDFVESVNFGYKVLKKKVEVFKIEEQVKIPELAIALCASIADGNPAFSQIFLGDLIATRKNNDRIVGSDVADIWPLKFPSIEDHPIEEYDLTFKIFKDRHEYNRLDTIEWWQDRIDHRPIEWIKKGNKK